MSFFQKLRFLLIAGSCALIFFLLNFYYMQANHEKLFMENLAFRVLIHGEAVEFYAWENEEEGKYYLFLPSGLGSEKTAWSVSFDDKFYDFSVNGVRCKADEEFFFDAESDSDIVTLKLSSLFGTVFMEKPMQIVRTGDLPIMLVTVEDEKDLLNTDHIDKKKYVETGSLKLLDENCNVLMEQHLDRFKVRGNLTAALDKKPFKLVLHEPSEMLGMASSSSWNLLANATDGSYIRNKLVLDLANHTSATYQPDGEFVELYLNGQYQGLYLLTEAVETGENRVEGLSQSDYFLEMEMDFRMEEGNTYVKTDRGQIFAVSAQNGIGPEEEEEITEFLNDIENALFNENGVSTLSGKKLEELIDMDSWADTWLIEEISGDHDVGIASQFAYTKRTQTGMVLYAGPVWDFDGAMGNVNTPMFQNPKALTASVEKTRAESNTYQNRWLAAMYRNKDFYRVLKRRYREVFDRELAGIIEEGIPSYIRQVEKAACLDALRWHEKRLSWEFVLPDGLSVGEEGDYGKYDTLEAHTNMVYDFLVKKRQLLQGIFVENRSYCVVEIRNEAPFLNEDYNQTVYEWVEKGDTITYLPEYEQEGYCFKGYYNMQNGQKVTKDTPVYEDCIIEGIFEQTGEN